MQRNISFVREILLFVTGILLIVYSTMNIAISPPPNDLRDIPKNYGKTYCLPIQSISTDDKIDQQTKRKINNAYVLMILSLVAGLFLVLSSIQGVYQLVVQVERLASTRQFQRQFGNV